jgi:lysophospholipase L1-like esterase
MFQSYVAIGDSFTEGVGDEQSDGHVRGWADFVALGFAAASEHAASEHGAGEHGASEHRAGEQPFRYANLAIRGRKLGPLLDEQLQPALDLKPDLLSLNGGGNDIMRPRVSIESIAHQLRDAVITARDAGVHVLLLSGANPSSHLPGGGLVRRRGDELATAVLDMFPIDGVTYVDNWSDEGLGDIKYWAADKLHLNGLGHARVASNVLKRFEVPVPAEWGVDEVAAAPPGVRSRNTAAYYRQFVLPWIGRRLTGRSSGDGRVPKIATLTPVEQS